MRKRGIERERGRERERDRGRKRDQHTDRQAHGHISVLGHRHKSHIIRKFTGKMPQARMIPERRHTLCASLHFDMSQEPLFTDIYR